jgi:hypothetical protein
MLNLRDAITIALILTLAAVIPLLIGFFTNANKALSSDAPSEFGDDEDKDDTTPPSDDWPSIIEVTGLEPLPKASLGREHINSVCKV